MSHWFDRLATRSVADSEGGEEVQLTRRQAVRAAAAAVAGVGAAGLLGGPLAGQASAIAGGNSRECKCWDKAGRINSRANAILGKSIGSAAVTPAGGIVLLAGLIGTSAAYLGQVVNCGLCKDDPPLKPPPPKLQPCTQRGGVRLRGDPCGGPGVGGAEMGSGCSGGTTSCPTPGGGDLCCFGSDVCCSGCCCIAEVGCGCCG